MAVEVGPAPAEVALAAYRGDPLNVRFDLVDGDGEPLEDLTGTVWEAQVRRRLDSDDVLAEFACTAEDASVTVSLTGTQTRSLPDPVVYDVQRVVGDTVHTYFKGSIRVRGDVTR